MLRKLPEKMKGVARRGYGVQFSSGLCCPHSEVSFEQMHIRWSKLCGGTSIFMMGKLEKVFFAGRSVHTLFKVSKKPNVSDAEEPREGGGEKGSGKRVVSLYYG